MEKDCTNRRGTHPEHPDYYCQAGASSNEIASTRNTNPTFRGGGLWGGGGGDARPSSQQYWCAVGFWDST